MAAAAAGLAPPGTMLMSVRVWVPRAPPGLGPEPPPGPGPGETLLRLQLSLEPGGGRRFRLGLRHIDSRRSLSLVDYNLKDISYEVKTSTCHELRVLAHSDEPIVFNFEDEREAQKWWTIISSSLREVHKAGDSTNNSMAALQPTVPLSAGSPLLEPQLEASLPLELSKKEDLALQLSRAIELGDEKEASQFAMVLARQQAALRILLRESCYPASEISMKVGVEDAACSANITIKVHPNTTIALLRHQVFQDYGFHPSVQRWIIGQCLCVDDRSVGSYGIRKDGDTAFLYLLSAKRAKLSEQRYEEDQAQAPAGLLGPEAKRKFSPLPSPLPKKAWARDSAGKMDIGEFSHYLSMLQVSNLLPGQPRAAPAAAAAPPPSPGQAGWACPTCTFINKPTRPGCEMCSTDRPAGYVVPGSYKPDEKELKRMQQEQDAILKYQQEKGRREDSSAVPRACSSSSLDDFIHLSSEFC